MPRRYIALTVAVLLLVSGLVLWRATTHEKSEASQPEAHGHANHAASTTEPATLTPHINPHQPPGPAPKGMVWIPGGTFWMGCSDCGMSDTEPLHLVRLDGFWMDEMPVTNAQFERFVRETRYVTIAERPLDPRQFPGVPVSKLVPGSAVFVAPDRVASLDNPMQWWQYVNGASWRHPEGRGSTIEGRKDHPVVHVAWDDAVAYLKWAGKELPTEAQFEFAARGGLDRNRYAWGNELQPRGRAASNIWQGRFPVSNTGVDGFRGTSPVTAFAANGFGLFDMGGNVWQWCADWYRPDYYGTLPQVAVNPAGPADSYDPAEPGMPKRVQRGGSFLCSDEYCTRYLVGSRGKGAVDSGSSNVGFRGIRPARATAGD